MITGQWGRPSEVLLDIAVDPDGAVRGIVNPGRQNAPIREGRFHERDSTVRLEGVVVSPDGREVPFRIAGRLIGFAAGKPYQGDFGGQLSKIYLRWEYHGLGLGRRLMAETARRFLDRGIESFILFAERSNPTIGFYDRMGGERLVDDRDLFTGAYAWRDVRTLLEQGPARSHSSSRQEP